VLNFYFLLGLRKHFYVIFVTYGQLQPNTTIQFIVEAFNFYRITLIFGFRRDVDEICGLLGYYTALCGNYLPKFRDNVSVPSSRVKIPSRKSWNLDP
jgi:hypothetical protein